MFFDDRLETVLRNRGSSEGFRCTQFRQLLDILGAERTRQGGKSTLLKTHDPELLAAAWLRMDALAETIPEHDRAAMIRENGWRFYNPELAVHLAQFEPSVASAALMRAQLTAEDWSALIPRLPVRARGFLRQRRDLPTEVDKLLERLGIHDRGLPAPNPLAIQDDPVGDIDGIVPARPFADIPSGDMTDPADPDTPYSDVEAGERSEISALVERIAQFKRTRAEDDGGDRDDDEPMPRLPLGEEKADHARAVRAFGFATNSTARIDWADPGIAAMVVGARLMEPTRGATRERESTITRAINRRQPIEDGRITLDGARDVAGDWIVNARPRFGADGNFIGYVGQFRRHLDGDGPATSAAAREADRIRQLLHELRTPITAIQGYAEVIQQQLFGSAPHEYRALAAVIAADAARILAGFEELDRLARLESGALEAEAGQSDFVATVERTIAQLAHVLANRMSGIEIDTGEGPCHVALGLDQAEALSWRLLATLGGGCAAGEMIAGSLEQRSGRVSLRCELPAQLLQQDDIFTADVRPLAETVNAGLFGAGFALRLARAEARSAKGDLVRDGQSVVLSLPAFDERFAAGAA